MYLDDLQNVIDSVSLVDEYHNQHEVKQYVNANFLYKNNKYVTEYISNLVGFSPYFLSRWKLVTQGKAIGPKRYWNDDFKTRVGNFLEECYSNQSELRSVVGRAVNSYTSTNNFSAEQRAYLNQLQSLPPESQKNAVVEYINKEIEKNKKRKEAYTQKFGTGTAATNKGQAINESYGTGTAATNKSAGDEAENEANQKLNALAQAEPTAATQLKPVPSERFADIGQGLPENPHPPADMEVIHEPEELATARKATVPVNIVNRTRAVLTNPTIKIVQRPIANAAKTAISTGQIKAVSRADSAINSFFGQVGRQSPVLTFLGARSGGGSVARRGLSLMAPKIPLGGKAAKVNVIFAIILGLLAFLLFGFNENATLCPPWQGCVETGLATPIQSGSVLTLKKTGTDKVSGVGQDITYTITVSFTGTGTANAEISDKVPEGTQFKESTDGKNDGGTVKWSLANILPNQPKILSFIVTTTKDNFWAVNNSSATYQVTSPIIPGGPDIPANKENCAGKSDFFPGGYRLRADAGNFGDPNCTMTRDSLTLALQQADSRYWKYILDVLIPCESVPPYNPSSHSTWEELGSHPETDRAGVWGLFSMGRGKNGPLDHGDVNWPQQVTNAVGTKNKSANIANPFYDYWRCAQLNPPPINP